MGSSMTAGYETQEKLEREGPYVETQAYIYFGDRGWWGKGGGYTSDLKQAQSMGLEQAVKFCQSRYNPNLNDGLICAPVRVSDVDQIVNK